MYIVERTCTEIPAGISDNQIYVGPQPLLAYRNLSAYVLLGDPGAGKTTAFEQEANQEDTFYISARDLVTFDDRAKWHGKTLFIDGLDEIRAGTLDARTPFDAIRSRLDKLGRPRFRLSCREADWFGTGDQERLRSVSPDGQVTILHLDPLTEADIVEILKLNHRVSDAKEFIQWAKQKGLGELLTNPQILNMLVKAVSDNNWPDSRKQTFELASQTIIREHNQEHIDATRAEPVDENQQLNDAGFLCAVQLIAGNAGYALSRDVANTEYPELDNAVFGNTKLLNEAARTKLFKAPIEGRIAPVHRHVAEYLAARYLAERIEHVGLPIGRIIALITGEDGVVVAELRGLSAWLAALCKSQRNAIIERDPLGVVLYGDVQDFTGQDKRRILDGLQREAARYPWFRTANWTASPFGALATPDMEEEFRTILTASDRCETHQALADCVLDAMAHGTKFTHLNDTLLSIVRDDTWWPRIRQAALRVVQRNGDGSPNFGIHLKKLLDEIKNGVVGDPDDDLMGYLLAVLYPSTVSPTEVLGYLHTPKRRNYIGSYLMFWDHNLLDQSSDSDVRALLDELTTRMDILQPILDDHHLCDLTAGLLVRALEVFGEFIEPAHLYKWLGVGLDKYGDPHSSARTHIDGIRSWLEAHPANQKSIINIGLDHCASKDNLEYCMHKVRGRLFQATPPADFGQWCLEQIRTAASDDIARYLLQEAVGAVCYKRGDASLSLEKIEAVAGQEPKYKGWLNDMLVCRIGPEKQEYLEKRRLRKAEEHKKKQEWLHYVKSHEINLRKGRAHPHLLHNLATAYSGHSLDSKGDTPVERLRNFLDHDEELVQAVFEGLCNSLERDDIPNVKDIIRLNTEGQIHFLSRPFLAGLAEITQGSPENITQLSDEQIKKAIAFYLADGTGEDPDWYKLLLTTSPGLVAEVMIEYVTAALHSNKQHISGLYALAYIDVYGLVARLVSLPLLKAFPVRSTNQQLMSLDELLKASLRHADRQTLLALIEKKLKLRSMNMAQRVRWLATGLIVAPSKYLVSLSEFTKSQEKRVQHLASFLSGRHDQWSPLDDLPVSALGLLTRLIGGYFAPYSLEGAGVVSPAMNAADFVSRLINRLGAHPERAATDILEVLIEDVKLQRWHTALRRAQFEQRAALREASFRHPNIRQVSETLHNLSPANASDLAALTVDVLQELAHRIRNGNTDDFRQFWNEGPRRQLTNPKHEDACRDALLSDLQQRLPPLGIDAQPEGHYADDKRADIRVVFNGTDGFEVPIEVKKNTHTDLWRSIHDQLIKKYTRDPRTHGFGIYLVFWFGSCESQPPPSGSRPRTADELEERLCTTLTADENRKISICVIDVEKPQ